jgi:ribosomal protein S18 acetylase RimI-like enzyme
MDIIKLEEDHKTLLEAFKREEWPEVDNEHYNNPNLDFSKRSFTLLAKDGDIILAYISFFIELGVAQIDSLIVGKKSRREGLATKLMQEAESQAKLLGAHKVRLETGVNWRAKSLYEKLGYSVRAVLPNYYGNNDFVLMDKNI